jgi:DNA-directed RNA polymerase specialized sigma24 family protein
MDALTILSKHHKEWVGIVKGFGEVDYANDVVQDVYLRLHKYEYLEKIIKDGEPNRGLMWIMLRNAAFEQNKKYSKELTNIEYNKEIVYNEEYIEEQEGYNRLINNVYKEIDSWHWYDAKLFTLYLEQDVSMRALSKMTNISIGSIFQTLKNCKERLRENVGDDWEDFLNKDFELI